MKNVIILPKQAEEAVAESANGDAPAAIEVVSAETDNNVKQFWRSMSELEGTKEFDAALTREFGTDVGEDSSGVSRRRFVQVMGASLALAGASGCRWDKQNIHSFTRAPASHIPGKPKYYASAFATGGVAQPVMVTSYDYRPIKVDGNPKHPMSNGASDMTTQATVLGLYDPDRSQHVLQDGKKSTWAEFGTFAKTVFADLAKTQGARFTVLAESTSSPTYIALKQDFAKAFPQAQWVWFDGLNSDNSRKGAQLAFGRDVRTMLELRDARVIVSLDDDFLGAHPAHVKYSADWAKGRKPEAGDEMSRIYSIESRLSVTGGRADHRLPLRSKDIKAFAIALEAAVRSNGAAQYRDAEVAKFITALAKDLNRNKGQSVVTVGEGQPAEVHALAHKINDVLGNVGKTVTYLNTGDTSTATQAQDFARVVDAMSRGQVDTVLVLGGNPAYTAPKVYGFADAFAKVKNRIHLSQYVDETSRAATWHLNEAHWLESWGDARAYDGTVSIVQPLIRPIYDGKSAIEVLSIVNGIATSKPAETGYVLTRRTFSTLTNATANDSALAAAPNPDYDTQGFVKDSAAASAPEAKQPLQLSSFDKSWRQSLFDGVVANTAFDKVSPSVGSFDVGQVSEPAARDQAANGELELTFYVDSRMLDGRHSNNAWLQETPDFITKLTWDNALLVGPSTAKSLDIKDEQMVKVTVDNRELTVPVYIQPGQAHGSMALALGYGRVAAGRVGGWKEGQLDHTIAGFDANVLRGTGTSLFLSGVKVAATGDTFQLASTQEHYVIDKAGFDERERRSGEIVRTGTLEEYKHHPDFVDHVVHVPKLESLFKEWEYGDHKWSMAIDLTSCTGCSSCVVACTAENNIPVVGKEQVLRNREMHWIRIDRYFRGNPDNPEVAGQVMICQQCENAPCEQVCPVGATVHSHEGLNDMVYNRCIGTRYCSNNCPYKVRRFNYFNYHEDLKDGRNEVKKMVNNPEVTVRFRGVMEKCTYCVQRIQNVKIPAKNEKRKIRDGEIQPACAQACPTDAIVFGDMSDPTSRVSKLKALPRNYDVLAELNVKPRTSYLARITNPNPELGGAS